MRGRRRSAAVVAAAVLSLVLTTACAPDPAPTPTPTGFASEEEAFAAAEATYRAYVDALNQVDLADPATFEPVYSHLSGSALSNEKKSLTTMHADRWSVSGETKIDEFYGESAASSVVTVVCLNVEGVKLTDESGGSVVNPSRPDVYGLRLTFSSPNGTDLLIDETAAVEDPRCSGS